MNRKLYHSIPNESNKPRLHSEVRSLNPLQYSDYLFGGPGRT